MSDPQAPPADTVAPARVAPAGVAPAGVPPLLHALLTARGPSGYEGAPAAIWAEAARSFAEVSTDVLGTPLAIVPPALGAPQPPPRLLVMGHIDEIGLIVSHIDDEGFLRFGQVGGWDPVVLIGQRVRVLARNGPVLGVIGRKPTHLLKDDDRKQVPETKTLHIDVGAKDADEARALVRIDTPREAEYFRHGGILQYVLRALLSR